MVTLNQYINSLFNKIIKGKRIKIDKDMIRALLKDPTGQMTISNFESIGFGKVMQDSGYMSWTLYWKTEKLPLSEYYYEYIESNEKVKQYLHSEFQITPEKIDWMQRIITGILTGYDCRVIDEKEKRYFLLRHFNHYLLGLQAQFIHGNLQYDETEFRRSFIMQTADTNDNREAISEMEYGLSADENKYGLKLKTGKFLLSAFAKIYFSQEVYSLATADKPVSFEEYQQICSVISIILQNYDSEKRTFQ